MEPAKTNHNTLYTLLGVAILSGALFLFANSESNKNIKQENEKLEILQATLDKIPLGAKAVSIYSVSKGEKIYGKNDEVKLPIASLAKIMTVTQSFNAYGKDAIVTITDTAIKQAGDFGLLVNEKWKIGDLAKLTILSSANDGAYALSMADPEFLAKLNIKNQKLGAATALFLNPTGLDISLTETGAFASAEDVNAMAVYALRAHPDIWSVTTEPEINLVSESGFTHNFKNTNVLVGKIPNLLFSKTGYTEIAGGGLVIIFKDKAGEEIAVTVLGSTFDGRFEDMEKLVNVLYNN